MAVYEYSLPHCWQLSRESYGLNFLLLFSVLETLEKTKLPASKKFT